MEIKISQRIVKKLREKHKVSLSEVKQCFMNRQSGLLEDIRVNHRTEPPTMWFIAETDSGRELKVVFMETKGICEIKTVYEPNEIEVRIYEKNYPSR